MQSNPGFFTDGDSFHGATASINLNNQGMALVNQGHYDKAEPVYKEALRMKIENFGPDTIQAALSYQALGNTQLRLGKLAEAEINLKKAVEIRNSFSHTHFDSAVSRETLAQVFEAKGNTIDAKAIRLSGAPNAIACGYEGCPGQNFSLNQLSMCSKCKCVYYCSHRCQKQDFKRHKAYCKKPAPDSNESSTHS